MSVLKNINLSSVYASLHFVSFTKTNLSFQKYKFSIRLTEITKY